MSHRIMQGYIPDSGESVQGSWDTRGCQSDYCQIKRAVERLVCVYDVCMCVKTSDVFGVCLCALCVAHVCLCVVCMHYACVVACICVCCVHE